MKTNMTTHCWCDLFKVLFNPRSKSAIRSPGFYVANDGVLTLIECEFARDDTYSCARTLYSPTYLPTHPTAVQLHTSRYIYS